MKLPVLIRVETIDAALRDAFEDGNGRMLVRSYDVPDHFTVARLDGCQNGLAHLNRIGLAYRAELLTRQPCKRS